MLKSLVLVVTLVLILSALQLIHMHTVDGIKDFSLSSPGPLRSLPSNYSGDLNTAIRAQVVLSIYETTIIKEPRFHRRPKAG